MASDADPEFQRLERQPDLYGRSVPCPQRHSFLQACRVQRPIQGLQLRAVPTEEALGPV